MRILPLFVFLVATASFAAPTAKAPPPVVFNTAFESASIGKIEKLSETEFRLHLRGQQDAYGRNRQTTWFACRLEDVARRAITLRIAGFDGEYNHRPVISWAGPWYRPVFSEDGINWEHFPAATWDAERHELTVLAQPRGATLWVAHIPLYPHNRALQLIAETTARPHARAEIIGQSVLGRPLHLVTVTNFQKPDAAKKIIWMQARQHAWETGTSYLLEGALRFVASEDPRAQQLRDENVFLFAPMINPDSVVRGDVRFNANGFDPNRQWDEVDLRDKLWLDRNPEIWYVKKALINQHAQQPIAIALNLHNTEMNEYFDTMVDAEPMLAGLQRFFDAAVAKTSFDPSRPKLGIFVPNDNTPANSTNSIWRDARVPMLLMETRIGPGRKLGRISTTQDRVELGRQLIALMAESVK